LAYHQPFQITGFHSCDKEVGLRILNGEDDLRSSNNSWDWLGPGIYFWEQNPGRALEYAAEVAKGAQKNSGKIQTPFVIGAIIELGHCLNLIEPNSINILKQAHSSLLELYDKTNQKMPVNSGPKRRLDCAVIKTVHESNKKEGLVAYDTIRSAFVEGDPIYPNSNFTERLHIEICILNPLMIKGYFLPRPIQAFNPYLFNQVVLDVDVP
jgi:hypothetical protein